MGFYRGPNLVTEGLVASLDTANPKSNPGSGTTWYDKSGYNNNASLVGGSSYSNDSIIVDGVNDTVEIASNSNIDLSNILPWSFSYTFKTNILPSAADVDFMRKGSSTTTGFLMFYGSPTGLSSPLGRVFMRHNAITRNAGTVDVTGVNTIVITYAGSGNMECYINGNYLGNLGAMTGTSTGTTLQMGYGNTYLNGSIYHFIKYNKQLSPQEVLQNYNATKSRFGL